MTLDLLTILATVAAVAAGMLTLSAGIIGLAEVTCRLSGRA